MGDAHRPIEDTLPPAHPAPLARRRAVGLAAVALAALAPAAPALAQGAPALAPVRLDAPDAVGAALAWSRYSFADGAAPAVLLARDDVFADSLASGVAQGALSAPLLLTPTDRLDPRVTEELERLGATDVLLLGGPQALSDAVETELDGSGYESERLAGETRRETAIAIAARSLPEATTALVARTGFNVAEPTQAFADSLAAGAYSAATATPVLYTGEQELSDSTRGYLEDSAIESVIVAGGTDAVSDAVLAEIDALLTAKTPDDESAGARRIAGANRAGTAVALAQELGIPSAADADRVILIEGAQPDAWAAGFPAAIQAAGSAIPVLLSDGPDLPAETAAYLAEGGAGTPLVCGPFVDSGPCDRAASLLLNQPVEDFPDVLPLPDGFQPEGIAIGRDPVFYAGSIPTGAIYRGDLATGQGEVFIAGQEGRVAVGLRLDARERLFVAGGPTGQAYVYSTADGSDLATYQLTTAPAFVNDVAVTPTAAYFTDSLNPVLYRVPLGPNGALAAQADVTTLPLTGDLSYEMGFNLNGIAALPDGSALVAVQSNTGQLFGIDPDTGETSQVDLGGDDVANGDGLLLDDTRTLYVVQNQLNVVTRVDLSEDLRSGTVGLSVASTDFDVPTTIAEYGHRLYAVNARFGTPPTPDTTYSVATINKP